MSGMERAVTGAAVMTATFVVTSSVLYTVMPYAYENGGWALAWVPVVLVGLVIFGQDRPPVRATPPTAPISPSAAVALPGPAPLPSPAALQGGIHVHFHVHGEVPAAVLQATAEQIAPQVARAITGAAPVVPGVIIGDVADVAAVERRRMR